MIATSNGDLTSDPSVSLDLDAGDVFEDFGDVFVGEFADVFGVDDLGEIRGLPLLFQSAVEGALDSDDDNFFDVGIGVAFNR